MTTVSAEKAVLGTIVGWRVEVKEVKEVLGVKADFTDMVDLFHFRELNLELGRGFHFSTRFENSENGRIEIQSGFNSTFPIGSPAHKNRDKWVVGQPPNGE